MLIGVVEVARAYVPNKVKNINVKVFNLVLRVNEIWLLVQYESCECKCRLNKSVRNPKQKKNHHKFWCECKELNDLSSCKNDYMCNPSTCDCECNKACKIDEFLYIKECSCEKRLFGKLA